MAEISAQELAELAPCSLDYVRRLEGLGILEADGDDGDFPPSDVHVVRLMAAFEEAGIALEDVARGVSGGALSFPLGVFMPDPVGMTETYAGLAARVGRSPDLLRRLSRELGLPPPSDDRVRAEDAEILSLIVTQLDLADDEELSRFARLYGGSVQRLVASGLQFFDLAVRQRVGDLELSDEERDAIVYQKAAGYTELVRTLVPWLQTRTGSTPCSSTSSASRKASWRKEESRLRNSGSLPRSRSSTSPGTRHWPKTEEIRPRPPWRRISRASYRRRRRHTAGNL